MILYHGSNVIVDKPILLHQKRKLDFGAGFYTTTNEMQAVNFAGKVMKRTKSDTQYVNKYEFNLDSASKNLSILHFKSADADWLEYVSRNRQGLCQDKPYDVVYGPVANDDVFRTFIFYEAGAYTKEQTLNALKIKKLYNQLCFSSEKALSYLSFIGAIDPTGGVSNE